MRKPQGPCEGRTERKAGDPEKGQENCHTYCEKYKAYKEAVEEYHKEIHERIRNDMATKYRPWRHKRSKDADKE